MRWVLVELEMVRMPDFVQCLDANLSFGCHDPVGKRMLLSSASATDMVADTFSAGAQTSCRAAAKPGCELVSPAENYN